MNNTISRIKLYNLVWSEPLTALAKEFAISYHILEKLCKENDIPLPKAGHWMKAKFGKKVDRPPLPAMEGKDNEIHIGKLSGLQIRIEQIKLHLRDELVIPQKLYSPIELVAAANKAMREKDGLHWRDDGMVTSARHGLDIRVSMQNISRTCCFWNTLIKCVQLRGHDITIGGRTYVKIHNESIGLSFREKTNRITEIKDTRTSTKYKPTGILSLQLDSYPGKEWKDGRVRIELRLAEIIAQIELIGEQMAAEISKRQRKKEIEGEILRLKKELEKRKQEEILQFKEVLDKSIRWRKAVDLREYLRIAEIKAKQENSLTEEFTRWLKWAREKADWYDPFIEKEDNLLGKYQHI